MPFPTLLLSLAALASRATADFWLGSFVASYPNGVYGTPGGIDRSGGCFIESGPDPTCDSPGVACDWVYAGGSSNFPNYCNTQLNCTWPNPGTVVHIESTGQDEECGKSTYGVNGIDPPPDGTYYGQIVDSDGPNGSGTAYGDCKSHHDFTTTTGILTPFRLLGGQRQQRRLPNVRIYHT